MGALSVNPAATGVYRYSEFVFTPGVDSYNSSSSYIGSTTNASKTRFVLGNVGYVGYVPTRRKSGLLNFNWSVTGNQTGSYVSGTSAFGKNAGSSWLASKADAATIRGIDSRLMEGNSGWNAGVPWDIVDAFKSWQINNFIYNTPGGEKNVDYTHYLANTENLDLSKPNGKLDQQFTRESWGYTYDFDVNFAFNISNKLFLGLSLTAVSLYYTDSEIYREDAVDKNAFETGFTYMRYNYSRSTKGVGFKLGGGLIYRPVAGLSIGASIFTPTWMRMRDYWVQDMVAHSDEFTEKQQKAQSPEGDSRYKMTMPFKWNVGVSYTFGKRAVVAADYNSFNASNMIFKDDGNGTDYSAVNTDVGSMMKSYHTFRLGTEVRVAPSWSVRVGYNYISSPFNSKSLKEGQYFYGDDLSRNIGGNDRHLVSGGFGYHGDFFFCDAAFQYQFRNTSDYLLYDNYNDLRYYPDTGRYDRTGDFIAAPVLSESAKLWRLLFSFGFRF